MRISDWSSDVCSSDLYIARRDDALRGRDGDEVPRIIADALRGLGVAEEAISIIPDEQQAVDAALRMGQPGDLVLVFADRSEEHTSELQSLMRNSYAVFCLKKTQIIDR